MWDFIFYSLFSHFVADDWPDGHGCSPRPTQDADCTLRQDPAHVAEDARRLEVQEGHERDHLRETGHGQECECKQGPSGQRIPLFNYKF